MLGKYISDRTGIRAKRSAEIIGAGWMIEGTGADTLPCGPNGAAWSGPVGAIAGSEFAGLTLCCGLGEERIANATIPDKIQMPSATATVMIVRRRNEPTTN
jgi:hypothetical protein